MENDALYQDENNQLVKETLVARITKNNRRDYTIRWYEGGEIVRTEQATKIPRRDDREGIIPFIEPTIIQERLNAIQKLFEWADTEWLKASDLLKRLQKMGIAHTGKGWNVPAIKSLMQVSFTQSNAMGLIGLPEIGKMGIEPRHYFNEKNDLIKLTRQTRMAKHTRRMPLTHIDDQSNQSTRRSLTLIYFGGFNSGLTPLGKRDKPRPNFTKTFLKV